MNVLFVEDEPVLRLTCTDIAEANGHTVRTAANAVDGLRLFRECRPDAVVTDLLMSGMDGFEFISILRESAPDLPIVVLTALVRDEARRKAEHLGATRFLVKPVSAIELVELLEQIHRASR